MLLERIASGAIATLCFRAQVGIAKPEPFTQDGLGLSAAALDAEPLGGLLRTWADHPEVQFRGDLSGVRVLGIHADGVQYTTTIRAGGAHVRGVRRAGGVGSCKVSSGKRGVSLATSAAPAWFSLCVARSLARCLRAGAACRSQQAPRPPKLRPFLSSSSYFALRGARSVFGRAQRVALSRRRALSSSAPSSLLLVFGCEVLDPSSRDR